MKAPTNEIGAQAAWTNEMDHRGPEMEAPQRSKVERGGEKVPSDTESNGGSMVEGAP